VPIEVFKLDDEDRDWLESVAKMYGLSPEDAARQLIGAEVEQERNPEDNAP